MKLLEAFIDASKSEIVGMVLSSSEIKYTIHFNWNDKLFDGGVSFSVIHQNWLSHT